MKFSARIFILIFLFLLVLCSPEIILADTANNTPQPWESFQPSIDRVESEELDARTKESQPGNQNSNIFASRITNMQIGDLFVSLIHMMGGWVSPQAKTSSYLNDQEKRGAIGELTLAIGSIYSNPPASGFAWVHDTLANAGLIAKPAYAQGIGFVGLAPLLPLWTTIRNISYAILVVVMVAIGFMIIFRTKIDPKTVISVQAALPKIILTLILITFSYPIVGFMIDLMYLAMAITINILATGVAGLKNLPPGTESMANAAQQQTEFMTGGWWKLIISVFNLNLLIPFIQQMFGGSLLNTGVFGLASSLGALVTATITATGAAITGLPALLVGVGAVSLIILFVIFLGLLFTLIRLTFLLVNSYIQILLALILAPLLLLKEAIPGQSAFSEWIQNLLANLIVFPATAAIIYLSWIFTALAWKSNLWGAPLIPVGGGGDITNGNPMAVLMGLGTIFLAPNLVASIKKAFHAKPALPITAGSAFAPVTGAVGTGMGAMSQFYYMQQIISEKGPFAALAGKLMPQKNPK